MNAHANWVKNAGICGDKWHWNHDHKKLLVKKSISAKSDSFDFEAQIKKNIEAKKNVLQNFGIKEWRILSSRKNDFNQFIVNGSYIDKSNNIVSFAEIYLQKKNKIIECLITSTSSESLEIDLVKKAESICQE